MNRSRLTAIALILATSLAAASPLAANCDPFHPRPDPTLDLNCDGRTSIYCGTDYGAIEQYDNALIQGFRVLEGGTYVLVGDTDLDVNENGIADYLEPDGETEDFFVFVDEGSSFGFPDGVASLDPALVGQIITEAGDYGDPAACSGGGACDQVVFMPQGNATGLTNGDAQVESPNCDRIAADAWESCILMPLDTISVTQTAVFPAGSVTEVIRGTIDQLTPSEDGVNLGSVTCLGRLFQGSTFPDPIFPPPGQIFFYVARVDNGGNYPYGACTNRHVSPSSGACSEP